MSKAAAIMGNTAPSVTSIAELRQMRRRGLTYRQIEKATGLCASTVRYRTSSLHLDRNVDRKRFVNRVVELRHHGKTFEDIGRSLGRAPSTCRWVFSKFMNRE